MPAIQYGKSSPKSSFDRRPNDNNKPVGVRTTSGRGKIGAGSNGNAATQTKKHKSTGRGQA